MVTPDPRTVLGKALTVLFAFTEQDHELSLAELGRRTGLAKGTLHRVAGDLVEAGLLARVPSGYQLGGKLFELGMRVPAERRLIEVATPFMEDLYERTHETVHLAVLDGTEVVYVSKIAGHQPFIAPSRVGGRMPVHCTALGKAMLAFAPPRQRDHALRDLVLAGGRSRRTPRTIVAPGILERQLLDVREQGVAYEYEESVAGIGCVAAPVLDPSGQPIAAISVTGGLSRFRPQSHAAAVKTAADGIRAILAVPAFQPPAFQSLERHP
ncbi:MAG: IclR family transcriptional regulator [Streptosporangiaceae bacterium]|jgi:DNA-binding IclR family transcriptional regulator